MKKRILIFFAAAIAGLLLIVGVGAVVVWMRIADLKNRLADNIGNALGAKVEVSSLELDLFGGEIHAGGISLTNLRPSAPWDHGEIGQATVRFHWRDFLAPIQPLEVEVSSWRLVLRAAGAAGEEAQGEGESSPEAPRLSRHGVEVTKLSASEGEVEIDAAAGRKVLIQGVSFAAEDNGGGTWNTQVQVASIEAGTLQTGAGTAEIRADDEKISLTNLRVQCGSGMISGEGEAALSAGHNKRATLQATGVPVTMLVAVPWQLKLSGLVQGDLAYEGDDAGGEATGHLALERGKVNVLPFLGPLVAMVGLPDLATTELDRATADFDWKNGMLHLSQIDLRKEGVLRLAGEAEIDPAGQVDARLKLGLPNSVASKWPQLQTAVFSSQADDCSWTDVHVTGTPDHLQEDLSSRLLAAGVQSGNTLLQQGAQGAANLLKSVLGP